MSRRRHNQVLISILATLVTACGTQESGGPPADTTTTSTTTPATAADSTTSTSVNGASTSAAGTILPGRIEPSTAVAGSLDTAVLGDPYIGDLTFAWPQGCSVPVVEEVLKTGRTASLQYSLGLTAEGQDLLVGLNDLLVTEVDNSPVPPESSAALSAQFALPSFLVNGDGAATDVVGLDALIEQLNAASPAGSVELTPQFAALLSDTVMSKYWGSWAGIWASWASFKEPTEIGESQFEVSDGIAVSDIEMVSLGTTDNGLVALRSTVTLDGADFALALGGTMAAITGSSDPDSVVFEGKRIITVEVVTDPTTLQPASAFASIEIELTEDGKTEQQLEERRWDFDWTMCS
jgi:hypothetical protein